MYLKISKTWQNISSRVNLMFYLTLFWSLAIITPYLPPECQFILLLFSWSSVILLLSKKTYGWQLAKLALFFMFFWCLVNTLINFYDPKVKKMVYPIIIWISLGLNLLLISSPLALAFVFYKLFYKILGSKASYLALSLALLARQVPATLQLALVLNRNISLRIPHASKKNKLIILGRSLISLSLAEADLLAKSILKRWPYFK